MPRSLPATSSKLSLPLPPSLWQTIGPSFILLGLALGSGELILWPYLAANWGLGLMWGGLMGITFQYILNTEVMRYSLAWGESVFMGFRRLGIWITAWYIFSTFIPWSLPGFSSASAQILVTLFPVLPRTMVVMVLLVLTGLVLSMGRTLYQTLEKYQRTILMLGIPFVLGLTLYLSSASDWQELVWGLVGRGNGYWFFPTGVAISSFVGAFAYSGAGGNLNLAQSYYIKEKGFGMGKYAGRITSLFAGKLQAMKLEGQTFADTPANRVLWKKWWRTITVEHFLVFWLLGFLTICLLTVLARTTVYGQPVQSGLSFLFIEATAIGQQTHAFVGTLFLLVAAVMLFSTQVGVLESSSRIISENVLLLFYQPNKKRQASLLFYVALWGQLALGAVLYLAGLQEPRHLLTLAALLNAAAMMSSFGFMLWLNKSRLRPTEQPGWIRSGLMVLAMLVFGFFLYLSW